MAFSKGDAVTWNTPQCETHGKVVEQKTKEFQHDGQTFKAARTSRTTW